MGEPVFDNKQCRSIDCQFLFLFQIRVWRISCKCLVVIAMKPTIWLWSIEQTWLELATDDKGPLSISKIATRTNLRPETLVLGTLGVYEGITIEMARDICGSSRQSKELAVLVDGIAKPPTHPKGMLCLAVKCDPLL